MRTVFLLLSLSFILLSCQDTSSSKDNIQAPRLELPPEIANLDVPFFIKKDSLLNARKLNIAKAYMAVEPVVFDPVPIEAEWSFGLDDPQHGIRVLAGDRPQQSAVVDLPHLLNKPSAALWYTATITVDSAFYLVVDADDGAQVFQDNQLLGPELNNMYLLEPNPASVIDIRVLNNHHTGGLRSVGRLTTQQFTLMNRYELEDIFLRKLTRQAIEGPRLTEAMTTEIIAAIQSADLNVIRRAERFFPPLLVHPYLQKTRFNEYAIIYERSMMAATQLDWINLQTQTPNRFLCEGRASLICETRTDLFEPGIPYQITVSDSRTQTTMQMYAPPNQLEYSFTAWGAPLGEWETFNQLVQQMSYSEDAFTIGLGDLVSDPVDKRQWTDLFTCLKPISKRTPLYVAAGDAEYRGYANALYSPPLARYFRNDNKDQSFYSWRSTYAAFIVLDPNRNFPFGIDQPQGEWLERAFASPDWQSADWRFLIVHQPPYSQARAGYSGDLRIRDVIDNIAGPTGIDFVLSSHTRSFERLTKQYDEQETTFLVMGGAGGEIEEAASSASPAMDKVVKKHHYTRFFLSDGKIRIVTYDLEGNILDDFERTQG